MKSFTLSSPAESKGTRSKKYKEILGLELGQEPFKELAKITLGGCSSTGWRVTGFGTSLEIPSHPEDRILAIPSGTKWDGNFKIEAKSNTGKLIKPNVTAEGLYDDTEVKALEALQ